MYDERIPVVIQQSDEYEDSDTKKLAQASENDQSCPCVIHDCAGPPHSVRHQNYSEDCEHKEKEALQTEWYRLAKLILIKE